MSALQRTVLSGTDMVYHQMAFHSQEEEMSMTSKLIRIISKHDKLLDFMDRYNLTGLIFATEEQLIEYIETELHIGNICRLLWCGWYDGDFGCTCPGTERWYQCPLEPEPDWDEIMKGVQV